MSSSNSSRLFKSVTRFGSLSALSGLSRLSPTETSRKAFKKKMAEKMMELRGVPMKLGQLFSMGSEDEAQIYRDALNTIEPIPESEVKLLISSRFTDFWDKYALCGEKAIAASIAQVYKVKDQSGSCWALKWRYPDMEKTLNLDVNLIGKMGKLASQFKDHFSPEAFHNVLQKELIRELDFRQEYEVLSLFYYKFRAHEGIIVPKPGELLDDSLFLSQWEEGLELNAFLEVANKEQIR
ncbi:MAG: AarF/ABC1/UbiB kinase family protein, partial [Planctomycetes bacterium]|nr:AarF/ABC1/UbiB kinase family protein [Planctomycetota bacterium]